MLTHIYCCIHAQKYALAQTNTHKCTHIYTYAYAYACTH